LEPGLIRSVTVSALYLSDTLLIVYGLSRVYPKTPNAPGQRVFSRCTAPFFLEIRQYSCEKSLAQRKNSALPVTSARRAGSFGDLRGRSKSSEKQPEGVAE
jgi:hypothetical protein